MTTAYTDEQAARYEEARFSTPRGALIHQRESELVNELVSEGGMTVEVGCGTGRLLRNIRGPDVTIGADASLPMLYRLRDHEVGDCMAVVVADAASLPFRPRSAQYVYSVRLLNQTRSRPYALSVVVEAARLVQPGGSLQIEFQNASRSRLPPTRRSAPVRLHPRQVRTALEVAGLSVTAVRGAFFFGITGYQRCPNRLLRVWDQLDRLCSRVAPRICSRVYVQATAPHKS